MSIAHILIRKAAPQEVRKVSKSLNALTGVERAEVDPVSNRILVEFADELVNLNQLRKTVRAAGIDVLSEWKEPFYKTTLYPLDRGFAFPLLFELLKQLAFSVLLLHIHGDKNKQMLSKVMLTCSGQLRFHDITPR